MKKTQKSTEQKLRKALVREQKATVVVEDSPVKSQRESQKRVTPDGFFLPHEPQTPQEKALYDQAVFTWVAPEYIQHPKSKMWYMIAILVIALVLIIDFITADYTMAIAVVVLAGVYYFTHRYHPPKNIRITVSRMGIKVGNMIFPFTSIRAFWILYTPGHLTTLNLRVKEHFFSDVIIQLHNEDPVPLREFLCGQIAEWEGKHESFGDVVLRLLRL